MNRLFLVNPTNTKSNIKMHNDIINILFSHKKEISNKFHDVKGVHYLDHIAINIFNPENEIVVFSFTPSIEYNLIVQDLWREDITFCTNIDNENTLIWWDQNTSEAYNEIKKIKETNHNFTLGFNLNKKVDNFKLTYSFATRNKRDDIRYYYKAMKQELILLGDYCYKLISDLYLSYSSGHKPPVISTNFNRRNHLHLKLISNNDIKVNT